MKSFWPPAVADMKANEGMLYVIDSVPDSPYRLTAPSQASVYLCFWLTYINYVKSHTIMKYIYEKS